jgi:hypothetical protein
MAVRTQSDKSVIYHIPKCGGIWVKEATRRSGVPYGRCKELPSNSWLRREHSIPANIIPEHKEGLSLCFVRHPVTWYESFWRYRMLSKTLDLNFPLDRLWSNTYSDFVSNVLDQYPVGFVTNLYQCYVGREADALDYIGRQENLVDDLVEVLTLAGEEFDEDILRNVKRFNVSSRKQKLVNLTVIDDNLRDRILDTEKWIIERFYA